VDTANMSERSQKWIDTAADADYMKTFEENAMKDIENNLAGMDKDQQEEWLTQEAKALYGTD
jgi:hypothetical protein